MAPISKEIYDSALDAMLKFGVQVCFVTPSQLAVIQKATDDGYTAIQELKSVNEILGINYKPLR